MKKTAVYPQKRAGTPRWFNTWFQSPAWLAAFGGAVGVCLLVYLINAWLGRLHPGSTWGLAYGIAAVVLFVGVMAYGLRRRVVRVPRIQRAWYYLQFHVYGGVLFLLLVLMHTNFSVPSGILTWWLWAMSLWIVASGLLGSAIQKWIPALLNASLSTEVNYQRIPELVGEARQRAEKIVASSSVEVQDFYREHMASTLAMPHPQWAYFIDPAGRIQRSTGPFGLLHKYASGAERDQLKELERIYSTKLEMDVHYTLQRALRWWLYLHVPFSLIVAVLIVIHVLTVLYY